MADDTLSVASGGSTVSSSNAKMECPHCNKDFQTRALFNHIRSKHPRDLLDSTLEKWTVEAANGSALKVVWYVKNDFDEEVDTTIYACMSSNKTFLTEHRANAHFKKYPEHAKEHVKQMKKFMKEVAAVKKAGKPCPLLLKYHEERKANSPVLARIMWRTLQFHQMGCEKILYEIKRRYTPEKIATYKMQTDYRKFLRGFNTLKEWVEHLEAKITRVNEMRVQQCLDVDEIDKQTQWLDTFIVASLPLLDGEIFDWMRCQTMEECIRPRQEELEEEMYYLAASRWHGVDF